METEMKDEKGGMVTRQFELDLAHQRYAAKN